MSGKPLHGCSGCHFASHDREESFSRMLNTALAEALTHVSQDDRTIFMVPERTFGNAQLNGSHSRN
jgi:hypothetical protein